MNFPLFSQEQIGLFVLVFFRTTFILMAIPIFGDRAVPFRVKAATSFLIAVVIFPTLSVKLPPSYFSNIVNVTIGLATEIIIGLILGFTARCLFGAIQSAGEIIGVQIGFNMSNILDPLSNVQITVVSEFLYLMGAFVFLIVDAHHIFLFGLAESFRYIPFFGLDLSPLLLNNLLLYTKNVLVVAVKLSAPVLSVMVLINISLAVIARTVPQINVFIVGYPLHVVSALLVLGLSASVFVDFVSHLFSKLDYEILNLLKIM
ncbi:MAG: flagellar biosynthetic protein FliR [Syntrophales bacterium]|nr:flagellar biosynthetic protein FliR [Syntrophales bacterium]